MPAIKSTAIHNGCPKDRVKKHQLVYPSLADPLFCLLDQGCAPNYLCSKSPIYWSSNSCPQAKNLAIHQKAPSSPCDVSALPTCVTLEVRANENKVSRPFQALHPQDILQGSQGARATKGLVLIPYDYQRVIQHHCQHQRRGCVHWRKGVLHPGILCGWTSASSPCCRSYDGHNPAVVHAVVSPCGRAYGKGDEPQRGRTV